MDSEDYVSAATLPRWRAHANTIVFSSALTKLIVGRKVDCHFETIVSYCKTQMKPPSVCGTAVERYPASVLNSLESNNG